MSSKRKSNWIASNGELVFVNSENSPHFNNGQFLIVVDCPNQTKYVYCLDNTFRKARPIKRNQIEKATPKRSRRIDHRRGALLLERYTTRRFAMPISKS